MAIVGSIGVVGGRIAESFSSVVVVVVLSVVVSVVALDFKVGPGVTGSLLRPLPWKVLLTSRYLNSGGNAQVPDPSLTFERSRDSGPGL